MFSLKYLKTKAFEKNYCPGKFYIYTHTHIKLGVSYLLIWSLYLKNFSVLVLTQATRYL